jgi:hypothetical protein
MHARRSFRIRRCPSQGALWAIALLMLAGGASSSFGQENEYKWSVSPYFGLHQPSLTQLQQEFAAPYSGNGTIIDQLGNGVSQPFTYQTPLAPLNPGTLGGLEFRYKINDKHSFIFGAATWEASSSTSTLGTMPIQGAFAGISAVREGDMRYTEYYLGWRYNLFEKPKKYVFYVTGTLHDVYDINYKESLTMVYTSGPAVTFRKTMVTEGHGTSLPLIQSTLGGEWFIADWLSVGIEGGYEYGLREITLQHGKTSSDVLDTDDVILNAPVRVDTNGQINCQCTASGASTPMKLDFNGWKVMLKASLYY